MRGRFWSSVYLVFLSYPLLAFLETGPDPAELALAGAGMAAFVALYLRVVTAALRRPRANAAPWAVAALVPVWLLLVPPLGEPWLFVSMFFVITALICALRRPVMLAAVAGTVAAVTGALFPLGGSPATHWWIPLQAALFAGALDAFVRLGEANRALRASRARAERLAVDNERLRFARDMHDILGHSLSVITLKSQLAGRLTAVDPDRARAEIREIEDLSRQALADVRATVAGYRTLSLPEEIDSARRALTAAGIEVEVSAAPVPPEAEPLIARVVREGATNVVRHSRASRCHIRYGMAAGEAYVEVIDDGAGPDTAGGGEGTGLRGLAERLQAAGGSLRGRAAEGGGFALLARLPAGGAA